MQKQLFLILFLLSLCLSLRSQPVNIPDSWFRFLIDYLDTNNDDVFTQQELAAEDSLIIDYHADAISDFTGLEYFVNIKYLDMWRINVKDLDLRSNNKLQNLVIVSETLENLNIEGLGELKDIYASFAMLKTLHCTQMPKLSSLFLSGVKNIHNLDLAKMPTLEYLEMQSFGMDSLPLHLCPKLKSLSLTYGTSQYNSPPDSHYLTHLDLSKNTQLESVFLSDIQDIQTIILDTLPKLNKFVLHANNEISDFYLPSSPALEDLDIINISSLNRMTLGNSPRLKNVQLYLLPNLDSLHIAHAAQIDKIQITEVGNANFSFDASILKTASEIGLDKVSISHQPYPNNSRLSSLKLNYIKLPRLYTSCMTNLYTLDIGGSYIDSIDIRRNEPLRLLSIQYMPKPLHIAVNEVPQQDPFYPAAYHFANGCGVAADFSTFYFETGWQADTSNCNPIIPPVDTTVLLNFIPYPNPSQSSIEFLETTYSGNVHIRMMGLDGKLYVDSDIPCCDKAWDFPQLSNGIYFLQIILPNGDIKRRSIVIGR